MLRKFLLLSALAAVALFSCKKKSTMADGGGDSGDSPEPLFSLNEGKVHAKVVVSPKFEKATTGQTVGNLASDLMGFTNTSKMEALVRRFPVETREGVLNIATKALSKNEEGFAAFVEFSKPISKGATVIVTVSGNLGATGGSSVIAGAALLKEALPLAGVDGRIDLDVRHLGPFGRFYPLKNSGALGDAGEVMGQTVITEPFLPQASAGVLFAVGKAASAPGWALGNTINMAIIVNFENRTTVQRLTISAEE